MASSTLIQRLRKYNPYFIDTELLDLLRDSIAEVIELETAMDDLLESATKNSNVNCD